MNTVIRIYISDKTSYVTLRIIHFNKSYGIHYSTVDGSACVVRCFRVSAEGIQSRIDGNRRIHGGRCPDGVCIAECVVIDRTFGVDIQLQVVFEERRSQHDASRIAFRIVGA